MKLIDKDAVITKIEKRIKNLHPKGGQGMVVTKILKDHYEDLLSFIDTLDVKEVDLEKEIDKFYGMYRDKNGVTHDMQDNEICLDWKENCNYHFQIEFAKHFFELGLKAKQE